MQIMEEESPSPLKIMDEEAPSPVLTTVEGLSSKIVHEVTWWEKVKHVIGPGFVICKKKKTCWQRYTATTGANDP